MSTERRVTLVRCALTAAALDYVGGDVLERKVSRAFRDTGARESEDFSFPHAVFRVYIFRIDKFSMVRASVRPFHIFLITDALNTMHACVGLYVYVS